MIKAITFDFWDTIVKDDSDEPKRAAARLPSKVETRLQLLTSEIKQHHPGLTADRIKEAFDSVNEQFRHFWKVEHFTPAMSQRFQEIYSFLNINLTPGFDDIAREVEIMELKISLDLAPGIHTVLAELGQNYEPPSFTRNQSKGITPYDQGIAFA